MIDVVFCLGFGSGWNNNEIRYALRSIEKHLKGFRDVYIVGECPDFLQNVIHIPFPDVGNMLSKNTAQKLLRVCKEEGLSKEFIYFNDDFYLTRDFDAETFPYYHKGDLHTFTGGVGIYAESIRNTFRELRRWKYRTLSFELHCPIRFKKRILARVIEMFNWNIQQGLLTRSLYGNACDLEAEYHPDVKLNRMLKRGEIIKRLKGKSFFTINDYGLNEDLKKYLHDLYPNKSIFEKPGS